MIVRDGLPIFFRMRVIVLTFISPWSACEAICQEDKSNAAQMQAVFLRLKEQKLPWFAFQQKHPYHFLVLVPFLKKKQWTNSNLQMNEWSHWRTTRF